MKNGRIQIHTEKMENRTTNRAKMSNKRCIKARQQYLQGGYKAREATLRATCFVFNTLVVFLAYLLDSPFRLFCLNNKINFSLANATNSASLESKMV